MGVRYILIPALFILILAILLSGIPSTKNDDGLKEEITYDSIETDKYYSMNMKFVNYSDNDSGLFWKNMESEENVTKLSDDQFTDGEVLINLPFGFPFFDLIVTRVAVTKQGTVQAADPSVNWTIAPLNAKFGLTRCKISYFFQDNNVYVQWNNFRFDHEYYKQRDFSFQVRLGARGEIDFVYRRVPYNLTVLQETCDCLEDKFGVMFSHQESFKVFPYKETYELGFSMDFEKYEVKQGTVVRFFPADWCMGQKNCYDCTKTGYHLTSNQTARCSWCPAIQKCSSTRDSLRRMWKENKCDIYHLNASSSCSYEVKELISQRINEGNGGFRSLVDDFHLFFIQFFPNDAVLTNLLWLNEHSNPKIVELDSRDIIGPKVEKKLLSVISLFKTYVRNVAILKSGSIESLYACGWNVSPLLANFNESAGHIRVLETDESLTVQWNSMSLHKGESGLVSFQARIYKEGKIEFVYRTKIPTHLFAGDDSFHGYPVFIGAGFRMSGSCEFIGYNHDLKRDYITENTVLILSPPKSMLALAYECPREKEEEPKSFLQSCTNFFNSLTHDIKKSAVKGATKIVTKKILNG
ncbi:Hypothetical predicted protein [Cloeon dipterum]|uniref:Uncharacterized protein n=1 Tax=Cloeon dipterum TaxID=197152 RepID=A0A8S1E1W8_9INSE|nr:Hypothetical predicted protein [Cloeon dipterum]